jgi:glycosyltransferase involved in cell wall biosynthesis
VACSNATSLPEVAADAAIFFDPKVPAKIANAMITLTDNEALRGRLINAGLQRAIEFSDITRMAKEYWQLFEFAFAEAKR